MKQIKRIILRIFFAAEIVLFAGSYIFGSNGLSAMRVLERDIALIENDVTMLTQETRTLETVTSQWLGDPFYKEKIAREQLQMARKGDQIFYIS